MVVVEAYEKGGGSPRINRTHVCILKGDRVNCLYRAGGALLVLAGDWRVPMDKLILLLLAASVLVLAVAFIALLIK